MEATNTNKEVCLEAILEENGIYLYEEGCTPEDTYRFLQLGIIVNCIKRRTEFRHQLENLFNTSANYEEFDSNLSMILDDVPLPLLYFASKRMVEYLISIGCETFKESTVENVELSFRIFSTIQNLMGKAQEFKEYENIL